jgi:protein-tyrosine phosphatase
MPEDNGRVRVCFVCSGNICRSPTAEAVLRTLAAAAGLDIEVDSAGTGGWHTGHDMDDRSRRALERAGYEFARHCAKQFSAEDFETRDLVIALDSGHVSGLHRLAWSTDDPEASRAKIALLRSFDPSAAPDDQDVADPFYGPHRDFLTVLDQVERACAGLVAALQRGDVRSVQQTESPPP